MKTIAVVDYGMGNLRSVEKALEKAGARVQITRSARMISDAAGVVLPGVGAFGEAVRRLTSEHLMRPLMQALEKGKPFLGICLGLQLLFERSEESPGVKGLGYFKGPVVRFRMSSRNKFKVPHMGWNTFKPGAAKTPMLKGISSGDYFYFVHSYYPAPEEKNIVAAQTSYGSPFCSAVARGTSLFASQFHPEKSGRQGLRLLRNFVQQVDVCS